MATFLDDKYYPTNASTAMFTNVEPYRSDQLASPQRNITIYSMPHFWANLRILSNCGAPQKCLYRILGSSP